ncbi:MAG TPA: methylmalonyl Co-A mutase-associated GTPase MeaB [Polyangiaceae bacterium]|jgi:LAO/AO transport system kinase|nr:methylmalonyl Co-A mutase-associated GTPase MeaB [Polyangiaceae bacterium]
MIDMGLVQRVLSNEGRAVARAMRLVDDRGPGALELLRALWPHTGNAWVLGVTGNPGSGKSTLCDRLIALYRGRGVRVGVVAVDPTSPYSGGAILGDRIRMSRHATDEGVFIRSLATRGHLGGLSRSARDVVRVLDASGYGVVIVETVGVGQDELEITRTAHSTLVVMTPGLGDEVQAIKAGILECADVFAVNKADRDGADATVRDLELMIALGNEAILALSKTKGHLALRAKTPENAAPSDRWTPPIVKCVATRGDGVQQVVDALDRHRQWVEGTQAGAVRKRARLAEEVRDSLREALIDAAVQDLGPRIEGAVSAVEAKEVDPYTATEKLVAAFRAKT